MATGMPQSCADLLGYEPSVITLDHREIWGEFAP
jgi:hypothetical protein